MADNPEPHACWRPALQQVSGAWRRMRVYTGHDDSMVWSLEESLCVEKCMLEDGHAVSRAENNGKQGRCFA